MEKSPILLHDSVTYYRTGACEKSSTEHRPGCFNDLTGLITSRLRRTFRDYDGRMRRRTKIL